MKKVILSGFFLLSYFFSYSQAEIRSMCDKLAGQYLGKNNGSLVIGVYNNGVRQIFYYGETEKGSGHKPDSNSIFELGNLTETFTCILFADQVIKGNIHDDDKLIDCLPVDVTAPVYQKLICEPSKRGADADEYSGDDNMQVHFTPYVCFPDTTGKPQHILLCYLGTHTSGLPDEPFNFHKEKKSDPYANYSTDDLYEFLRSYRLSKPIGFDYKHSELGIAILGKAISLKLKKNFETLLVENILDTLKMNDTRITLKEDQSRRQITGYINKGNPAKFWTSDVYAPVMGLHSSPVDMMNFLAANISVRKNYLTNLLDYTHNPRLKPGEFLSPGLEIGLGWKISPTDDLQNKIVWQSGITGGFASYVGFIETSHTGVFILSSISKDVNSLGITILQSFDQATQLTK